jgi:LPXTG-motif cell wall-anchored protein
MKTKLLFFFLLVSNFTWAQADSIKPVEPNMETSSDNQELMIIALVGLVILLVLYFFFRKRGFKR